MTPNSNGWCWRSGLATFLAIFGGITSFGASSLTQATSDVKLGAEISGLEVFVAQAAPTPPPPPPPLIPTAVPTTPPRPAPAAIQVDSTATTQSAGAAKPGAAKPGAAASTPPK